MRERVEQFTQRLTQSRVGARTGRGHSGRTAGRWLGRRAGPGPHSLGKRAPVRTRASHLLALPVCFLAHAWAGDRVSTEPGS